MTKLRALLLAAALALPAAPAAAFDASPADRKTGTTLSESQQNAYRLIFTAIREREWANAADWLDAMDEGPLHPVARAELYLARGSPRVGLDPILALLAKAPEMPQAAQLARLAEARGATETPTIPEPQKLVWAGTQPRRERPRPVKGDPVADALEPRVQALIEEDQPAAAEALLLEKEAELSPEALTSLRQRIAWSHYLVGSNSAARELALKAARQGLTEWAIQAEWVAGLASWRMGDCKASAESFGLVGSRSADPELSAAGHYWTARSHTKCERPERVQSHLRTAARMRETFYGLIAASALGIRDTNYSQLHDYRDPDWRRVSDRPNVRRALALIEIGETALADEFIRHQAKIGGSDDHDGLLHLAETLSLPSTQYWLAHNAPRGIDVNASARYPMPEWRPDRGWRVDQALVYAHALQESNFRANAVSHAGAVGLLQVRPGTAGDIARSRGQSLDPRRLTEPSANLEYGQSYLEYLRDYSATGGLLPKVMAAYNAGPGPVAEWNVRYRDQSDPLLYIESLPYWETRGYVPIVLRNYWIYEQKAGKESPSRAALAQGLWPRFPGLPGPTAVRLEPNRQVASNQGSD